MKILSIDALADCCGCDHEENSPEACWTWNNWFTVGKTDKIPSSVQEFAELLGGFNDGVNPDDYLIDDDQYNIVLIEKKSMRPLYAVEYGANN